MIKKTILGFSIATLVLGAGFTLGRLAGTPSASPAWANTPPDKSADLNRSLNNLIAATDSNKTAIEAVERRNNENISSLKQEMRKLSALTQDSPAQSDESTQSAEAPEPDEYEHPFERKLLRERSEFDNEIVDFTWAPTAENDLDSGLGDLQDQLGFELVNAECRTNRCKATVAFDNYELAELHGSQLAEVSIPGLNCAQSIVLSRPGDTSASYQAELILDCTQQVQGKVSPVY